MEIPATVSGPRLRRRGLTPKQCSFAHVSAQWGQIFSERFLFYFLKHLLIHKMFCDKKFFYNKNIHHSIVRRNVMLKCSCIKKKCYFRIFFTPLWNLNWDAFSCLHHLLYHYSVEHSGIIVLFFFPLIFQFYLFIDFAHIKKSQYGLKTI